MIELRPYQSRTIEKLWAWFRRNPSGHPIVEVAVGGGKSILVAETIRQALEYPGARVLMCVASRELCKQNAERLLHLWPEAPVGIYSAGLKSRNLENRIIYATIGSIYKRWHQLGHLDLLLIDEAHNVSAKDRGMYRDLIRNLHQVCPNMRVIGWTGTAFHGNGVWLHDGDEPLFTDIAARVTMRELLDQGYLAPLVTPKTTTRLSADGVRTRGGDFIVSQLAKAIDKEDLVSACADELAVLGAERKRWFVFAATVEHCHHVRDALRARGISAEVVSANTPHKERDAYLSAIKAGRLRALVSVACLTTGIDVPNLDLVCLMRNTRSPVLFVQMLGRAMRTAPEKHDALFVDFTDSLEVLGPVDLIKGRAKRQGGTSDAPFKTCDNCGARNAASARECIECGQAFEIIEKPRHSDIVSTAPALSSDFAPRLERHEVHHAEYRYWPGRDGKPPTLNVTYSGPLMRIASEWLCFEHQGYARSKAVTWWVQRAPGTVVPKTIEEAEQRAPLELRIPSAIIVDTRPKYPEIKSYEWPDTNQHAA
jgi:DNA repair protein RadD